MRKFPLVRLRDASHLAAAIAVPDGLLRLDRDAGRDAYLDVLTDLVEAYEAGHVSMPDVSAAEMLRGMMDIHGLSQSDLARETRISQSTTSAVLGGMRDLAVGRMKPLAKRFSIRPAAFLPS